VRGPGDRGGYGFRGEDESRRSQFLSEPDPAGGGPDVYRRGLLPARIRSTAGLEQTRTSLSIIAFRHPEGFMHIWLQVPTPTAQTPVWQITQDKVPYLVLLGVALLAFLFGTLFRPLLEDAGNALRRWMKGLGKTGDFRQRYLTSIIGQYRHSAMLPANVVTARWEYRRKAVELEELYTPLSLGGEREEEMAGRLPAAFRRSRGKPSNRLQTLWMRLRPLLEPTAGDVGETILNQPRLVIRGDPGSGKTTLLRYLALSCARSLRNDRKDGDARNMVGRRLGWRKRLFPIVVPLNLLATVPNWPQDRRLIDEIANTLPGELRSRYPAGFLEDQLHRGNCLVLFDGFDEFWERRG